MLSATCSRIANFETPQSPWPRSRRGVWVQGVIVASSASAGRRRRGRCREEHRGPAHHVDDTQLERSLENLDLAADNGDYIEPECAGRPVSLIEPGGGQPPHSPLFLVVDRLGRATPARRVPGLNLDEGHSARPLDDQVEFTAP